jgi:hypothetical protein
LVIIYKFFCSSKNGECIIINHQKWTFFISHQGEPKVSLFLRRGDCIIINRQKINIFLRHPEGPKVRIFRRGECIIINSPEMNILLSNPRFLSHPGELKVSVFLRRGGVLLLTTRSGILSLTTRESPK